MTTSVFIIIYRSLTYLFVTLRAYSFKFDVPTDSFINLRRLANKITPGHMFILTLLSKNLDKFAFGDLIDALMCENDDVWMW